MPLAVPAPKGKVGYWLRPRVLREEYILPGPPAAVGSTSKPWSLLCKTKRENVTPNTFKRKTKALLLFVIQNNFKVI